MGDGRARAALVSALLIVVAGPEAGAIRRLRSELQVVRAEREPVKAALTFVWIEAMKTAIRRTDAHRLVHPDLALPDSRR
jgi:hypothetical protein